MAVPKRKTSKARRDKRRSSHWKLAVPGLVKCPKCGIAERFGVKCSGKNHFSDFKLCIDKESCDFRRKNFFNVFCACSGPLSRRLVDFSDGFCYSESSSTRIRYQLT